MYLFVHIYIYIHTYKYIHISICMFIYIYTYIYMYKYINIYLYKYTDIHIYTCIYESTSCLGYWVLMTNVGLPLCSWTNLREWSIDPCSFCFKVHICAYKPVYECSLLISCIYEIYVQSTIILKRLWINIFYPIGWCQIWRCQSSPGTPSRSPQCTRTNHKKYPCSSIPPNCLITWQVFIVKLVTSKKKRDNNWL